MSTGRKIWIWSALLISGLILLMLLSSLVGVWAARGVAVDLVTAGLTAVHDIAEIGRDTTSNINDGVGELRGRIGAVQTAVAQVAQNVQDRGLIVTLLPPEREQELQRVAQQVSETATGVAGVVEAAAGMWQALDSVPFIDMPQLEPERAVRLETSMQEINAGVDQLAADVQAFRNGSAERIDNIAQIAGTVDARLATTQDNLAQLDNALANVQTRALELIDLFRLIATIVAVVNTLILAWLVYALIMLMRRYWSEWQVRQ